MLYVNRKNHTIYSITWGILPGYGKKDRLFRRKESLKQAENHSRPSIASETDIN
jgi:hypothetical protein